ncbi:MAG TPA: NUDIX domain-containing protein [Candidatus Limnocylindrales bacterium]|nr:NUDIX domain-containing protein [Candidatus Limnocylindrales bacterium]
MTKSTEGKIDTPSAMTPDRLTEIKARVEKATAGPWEAKPHDHTALGCKCIGCTDPVVGWFVDHPDAGYCSDLVAIRAGARELNDFGKPLSSCDAGPLLSYEDAEFAAEARRDVPDLLAEVERVSQDLAEALEEIKHLHAATVPRVMYDSLKLLRDEARAEAAKLRAGHPVRCPEVAPALVKDGLGCGHIHRCIHPAKVPDDAAGFVEHECKCGMTWTLARPEELRGSAPVGSPAVVHRQTAKALILDNHGRVLLLREAKTNPDGTNAGRWGLPGGRLEPGESLGQGLVREVAEETNLAVCIGEQVHTGSWTVTIRGVQHLITAHFFPHPDESDGRLGHRRRHRGARRPSRRRDRDDARPAMYTDHCVITALIHEIRRLRYKAKDRR